MLMRSFKRHELRKVYPDAKIPPDVRNAAEKRLIENFRFYIQKEKALMPEEDKEPVEKKKSR